MKDQEPPEIPQTIPELMEAVSKESGTTPAELAKVLFNERERIHQMIANDSGKFRVMGIDKFDGSDWIDREFDSPEEAIKHAREKTDVGKKSASDSSIATVYYAYTPDGKYIGGDTWTDPKKTDE